MCRPVGLAVLLGCAALVSRAEAQSTDRAAERRVDSVVAYWRRAQTRLKAYNDSVATLRSTMDTLRVGSMNVLVQRSLRARAEAAARLAWAFADSAAGPAAKRLEKRTLVVRQLRDSTADSVVVAAVSLTKTEYLELWGAPSDSMLTRWLAIDAMKLIEAEIDKPFRDWLHAELSPDTLVTQTWLFARLQMVSSPSLVAQQCYRGDIHACGVALQVTDVQDPATEWYDAAGRRKLVASGLVERHHDSRAGSTDEESCVTGDDDACLRALRAARFCYGCTAGVVPPLPAGIRLSVAKLAIRMGGRDGYERILGATGTPSERLATAAGVPVDSLLRVWQAQVRDTRLPSDDFSFGIAASSVIWIAACGFLSLRSTRWR